jgi:hypothetical protein
MSHQSGTIPRRPFGSTGEEVSLLGVGGFHIGVPEETQDQSLPSAHPKSQLMYRRYEQMR